MDEKQKELEFIGRLLILFNRGAGIFILAMIFSIALYIFLLGTGSIELTAFMRTITGVTTMVMCIVGIYILVRRWDFIV